MMNRNEKINIIIRIFYELLLGISIGAILTSAMSPVEKLICSGTISFFYVLTLLSEIRYEQEMRK